MAHNGGTVAHHQWLSSSGSLLLNCNGADVSTLALGGVPSGLYTEVRETVGRTLTDSHVGGE